MCPRTSARIRKKKQETQSSSNGRIPESNDAGMSSAEAGVRGAAAEILGDEFDEYAAADEPAPPAANNDQPATDPSSTGGDSDWPLTGIRDPTPNDVLYGRGGGTNHHPGNKRYRRWVEDRKVEYVNSKRLDKPVVALDIVRAWRSQDPPGRFLKMDDKTGLWTDVGDKKAREKTSQALREKAPQIRRELEEAAAAGEVSLMVSQSVTLVWVWIWMRSACFMDMHSPLLLLSC